MIKGPWEFMLLDKGGRCLPLILCVVFLSITTPSSSEKTSAHAIHSDETIKETDNFSITNLTQTNETIKETDNFSISNLTFMESGPDAVEKSDKREDGEEAIEGGAETLYAGKSKDWETEPEVEPGSGGSPEDGVVSEKVDADDASVADAKIPMDIWPSGFVTAEGRDGTSDGREEEGEEVDDGPPPSPVPSDQVPEIEQEAVALENGEREGREEGSPPMDEGEGSVENVNAPRNQDEETETRDEDATEKMLLTEEEETHWEGANNAEGMMMMIADAGADTEREKVGQGIEEFPKIDGDSEKTEQRVEQRVKEHKIESATESPSVSPGEEGERLEETRGSQNSENVVEEGEEVANAGVRSIAAEKIDVVEIAKTETQTLEEVAENISVSNDTEASESATLTSNETEIERDIGDSPDGNVGKSIDSHEGKEYVIDPVFLSVPARDERAKDASETREEPPEASLELGNKEANNGGGEDPSGTAPSSGGAKDGLLSSIPSEREGKDCGDEMLCRATSQVIAVTKKQAADVELEVITDVPERDDNERSDAEEDDSSRSVADPPLPSYGDTESGDKTRQKDISSLVFVFDTTGSMHDDLVQARQGAKTILNTFLDQEIVPVSNYILVPFNDPLVGPITVTEEPTDFVKALDELSVRGGGDCPEMSATGILEALETAHPNSYLYIFTDASAKDHYKYDDILEKIQRKHSQVVFILTGRCRERNQNPMSYRVYDKIAAASAGQVFHLDKAKVDDVMNFVRDTLRARGITVFSVNRPSPLLGRPHTEDFNVTVEKNLDQLTVTLTGNKPSVDVRDPLGETPKDLRKVLDLPNVVVINVDDPKPAGTWTVNVTVQPKDPEVDPKTIPDGFTLHARGTGTSYKINQGFSVQPAKSLQETANRPLEGSQNFLTAQIDPVEDEDAESAARLKKYTWTSVDFLKLDGRMLWSLPLKPVSADEEEQSNVTKLSAGPFSPPPDLFNLVYNGFDDEGTPISRSTPNAISAQHTAPPLVTMIPQKTGFEGQNLKIKCQVESLIPFTLDWYKDGILYKGNLNFEQSSEVSLTLDSIKKDDEGNYTCSASNRRGTTFALQNTTVKVIEPPKITDTAISEYAIPEKNTATLDCIVKSEENYKVKWSHKHDGKSVDISPSIGSGKYQQLHNNSLLISSLNKYDSGLYTCSAFNIAGNTTKEIELQVILPPEISTSPKEEFYFLDGETILVECNVKHNSKANITWEFNEVTVEQFSENSNASFKSLSIPYADKKWEGTYVCVAVNEAGKSHKEVKGIYVEAPIAQPINQYVLVKEGEVAVMNCSVSGKPKPEITWYHDELLLQNNDKYKISPDGLSLSVFNAESTDEGSYKCMATGPRDTKSSAMFNVKLGSLPQPKHRPSDSSVGLWEEGWFPCSAEDDVDVNLFPETKSTITWKRESGEPLDSRRHEVLESGTLHISNADISDEGVYICTIENAFGKLELEMDLEITGFMPPMITGMLESQLIIPENKSVVLNCTVVTELNYDVQWIHQHNGKHDELPLYEDDRVLLLENNSLVISSVNTSDAGTYICSASNRAGTTIKEVELTIMLPPKITTSPEDEFYFFKGENIFINCSLEDDGNANLSWEFNGVGIEQFSTSTDKQSKVISISLADKEWEGTFLCIAVNEAGKVQKEIKSIFVEPPEVISEKQHIAVKAGETAELECSATGHPKPKLTWYHDDHILLHSEKYEISSDGTSLKILNSKSKDEGYYICVAEVLKNINSSLPIKLVLGRPPRPKEPYPYSSLKLGEEGSFPCSAEIDENSHLFPGMQVKATWAPKDRPLDSERHIVLPSGILHIINATTSDDGVYICTLENDFGKIDLEMDLEIIGLVPPTIIPDGDESISYINGERITLLCNASGKPEPSINWFYRGNGMHHWQRLESDNEEEKNISISGRKLTLMAAEYDSQGLYSCTAENEAGFSEKIFYLDMKAPPIFLENGGPVDISLVEGESYSLYCIAKGSPDPSIKWIKNGMELPEESFDGNYRIVEGGLSLEIFAVRSNTDGYYTCVAENEAGKIEKTFKVKVLVPPANANFHIPMKAVSMQVKEGSSLKITCPIATGFAVPVPIFGWSKDGELLHTEQVITSETGRSPGRLWITESGKSLHIDGVTLNDAGNYSCIGFNKAGRFATHAADVEVFIPPNHSPGSENNSMHEVKEGEDITFNCSVMGVPKPKVIWIKDGMYLPDNHPEVEFHYTHKEDNVVLAQLSIPKAQSYHSGLYKCLSHNHIGNSSLSFDLDVLVSPIVQGSNETAVEVHEGGLATLNCSIAGNPEPTITWHKLSGEVNEKLWESQIPFPSALELQNIHPNESGIYTCTGSNHIGSTKKTFNVSVLVAPSLEDETPVKEMVTIGGNITLECNTQGNPRPSIVWLKNGYLLGNAFDDNHESQRENIGLISRDGRLIHLENVDKDEDGNYTCIAYNKAGSIERNFIVETVAPPSFYDWNIPDMVKVLNGSSVKFDCSATGKPKPKVQWSRLPPKDDLKTYQMYNDMPLLDSKKGISTTNQLFFESINVQNSAVYVCKAENKVGAIIKTFHLDVHVPPAVEGHIADENGELNGIAVIKNQPGIFTVQVIEGQTITLSCRVLSGRPSPRLMWLKDGKRILKNIHQSQSPHRYFLDDKNSLLAHGIYVIDSDETLVLSNITEEQAGPYKCVASNVAGTNQVHFNVEVFVPPAVDEDANIETDYSVKVHSFIALTCPVTGKPDPVIKWFKDSEEIDEDFANMFQISQDRQRLIIMQAEIENSGEYTCVATNDAGTKKINYKVSVLEEQLEWSPWSSWSACSSSCGVGTRKRYRECAMVQPNPKQIFPSYYRTSENQVELHKKSSCPGDDTQIQKCLYEPCANSESEEIQPRIRKKLKKVRSPPPKKATLNLQGRVNGQNLNPSFASANYDQWNNGPTLEAEVDLDPYDQGNLHPYLPFILSPLTWSTAGEIDGASNGYSLTDGVFKQHSQLEFMSGETLHLAHTGHGVDSGTGEFKVHIEVEGEVPQYQSDALVYLEPFSEMYVQTSPSSLYAYSMNDMNVDGQRLPYKWNSSLHYDSSMGTMGYLVEQLSLENVNTYNDYENRKIVYSSSPKITKKYSTNRCPDGFNLDENNLHCIDVDECKDNLHKCHESQSCKNEMGSYQCLCPQGFISKNLGQQCIDINECIAGKSPCSHECFNTHGSFYCGCPKSLKLMADGHTCENKGISGIRETEKSRSPILDLLPDYHIVPLLTTKPPVHFWSLPSQQQSSNGNNNPKESNKGEQTHGWLDHKEFQNCPSGFVSINGTCQDIDECTFIHGINKLRHKNHKMSPCPLAGQQCINTKGSYLCVEMSCSIGFEEVEVDFAHQNESLRYCLQLCDSGGLPCQEKAEIAEIVVNSIVVVDALKPRLNVAKFSVPITAKNERNQTNTIASTTRTTFHKLEEETGSLSKPLLQLFRVRSEGTDGILYSMKEFKVPGVYRVAVMALTYNGYSHHVLYATKFVINIYVTGY